MAKRPKLCLLDHNSELKLLVLQKLELKWSPEQISGWLKKTMSDRQSMQISAETIYKTLYYRTRFALHHTLVKHLRRSHSLRQSKRHSRKGERGTINIVHGASIRERPADVATRETLGHWEGDLVTGSKNTHIATLVDRKSRFTIILKLKGKDATSVTKALIERFKNLPATLCKSLTWDRGIEWLSMRNLLKIRECLSIFVIRKVLSSEVQMKIPTVYYVNTFPKELIYQLTHKQS
jgi:IS30 family transposase